MSHNKDQHVDLYAILPFAKFKAMDQKVKKTESMPEPASTLNPPDNPSPKSEPEGSRVAFVIKGPLFPKRRHKE